MKLMKLNIQLFGHTNETTNYDLPQFVGNDKPTWLGDFNSAMSDIDTAIATNATAISGLDTRVTSAEGIASQASSDVSTLTSTVNTLSTNVSTATTTANNAQSTATSALNTANTADGKADTNASAISTLQSTVSTNQSAVEDALYFKNGDTYTFTGYMICPGIITSSGKALAFSMTLPKSMKNVDTMTLSSTFLVDIRIPSGGYATGNAGVNIGGSGYTKTFYVSRDNVLTVNITSTTNWGTNNIPVAVAIQDNASITFTTTGS